jgi:hypothetical protein
MSEPNQLYARIRISRPRLDEFLRSPFPDPSDDAAVLAWLSTASYFGDRYTPEKIREQVVSAATTVGAWIDWLMSPAPYGFPMPSANEYDDSTQTWTIGVLDFSENYDDYTAAVAVFRAVTAFKDVPGDDCMLIFAFLFGSGEAEVALRIDSGASEFLDESAAAEFIPEATAAMEALMAKGAAQAGEAGSTA